MLLFQYNSHESWASRVTELLNKKNIDKYARTFQTIYKTPTVIILVIFHITSREVELLRHRMIR